MHQRACLFGGAIFAAGLVGGAAHAGPLFPTSLMAYGGVIGETAGGEQLFAASYGLGALLASYDADGLAGEVRATVSSLRVEIDRAEDDTLWAYSYAGMFGSLDSDSAIVAVVSWDFGAWDDAGLRISEVGGGGTVIELDVGTDPQSGGEVVALAANVEYAFELVIGNEMGLRAAGGGVGLLVVGLTGSPIARQPRGALATVGGSASLSVFAPAGDSFQWRRDGVPVSGGERGESFGIAQTLEFASVSFGDEGVYDCVVMLDGVEHVSEGAMLGVRPCLAGDANGDGAVDFSDLNAVLAQFGAGCGE